MSIVVAAVVLALVTANYCCCWVLIISLLPVLRSIWATHKKKTICHTKGGGKRVGWSVQLQMPMQNRKTQITIVFNKLLSIVSLFLLLVNNNALFSFNFWVFSQLFLHFAFQPRPEKCKQKYYFFASSAAARSNFGQ